jgi:hypothetical protein
MAWGRGGLESWEFENIKPLLNEESLWVWDHSKKEEIRVTLKNSLRLKIVERDDMEVCFGLELSEEKGKGGIVM